MSTLVALKMFSGRFIVSVGNIAEALMNNKGLSVDIDSVTRRIVAELFLEIPERELVLAKTGAVEWQADVEN